MTAVQGELAKAQWLHALAAAEARRPAPSPRGCKPIHPGCNPSPQAAAPTAPLQPTLHPGCNPNPQAAAPHSPPATALKP